MAWTTPVLVEICIGLEINGYMPADGYVQIEEQAISKEVHRHPRRRRSLPAMRQSDTNQGVCWPQRKRRTLSFFLHPLVLLHE